MLLHTSKTRNSSGVKQIFTWQTGRREAYEMCLAARPLDIAPYLFCTAKGESYIDENERIPSFNSVWQKYMDRVLEDLRRT